jgi:hypothetical protein
VASEEEGALWMLSSFLEKRREFNLPTFILFVNYEKAYDSLNQGKAMTEFKG